VLHLPPPDAQRFGAAGGGLKISLHVRPPIERASVTDRAIEFNDQAKGAVLDIAVGDAAPGEPPLSNRPREVMRSLHASEIPPLQDRACPCSQVIENRLDPATAGLSGAAVQRSTQSVWSGFALLDEVGEERDLLERVGERSDHIEHGFLQPHPRWREVQLCTVDQTAHLCDPDSSRRRKATAMLNCQFDDRGVRVHAAPRQRGPPGKHGAGAG
jgi:hypothetical protein